MTGLPVPAADDPDTGGFFAAAQRHELALCYCSACDSVLHLPKAYCHHCGSWDVAWRAVRPAGTLHSFTIVEHQVHPAFPVPHTLVLVSIDDEPAARLVGHIPGRHLLTIGSPMRAVFEQRDGATIPNWEPVEDGQPNASA